MFRSLAPASLLHCAAAAAAGQRALLLLLLLLLLRWPRRGRQSAGSMLPAGRDFADFADFAESGDPGLQMMSAPVNGTLRSSGGIANLAIPACR